MLTLPAETRKSRSLSCAKAIVLAPKGVVGSLVSAPAGSDSEIPRADLATRHCSRNPGGDLIVKSL